MKIYVDFKPANTINEFLKQLFIIIPNQLASSFVKTYFDPNCEKVQCERGKMRSFDDVYYIINTYFPNTSVETVFKELMYLKLNYNINPHHFNYKIAEYNNFILVPYLYKCSTMQRVRIIYYYRGIGSSYILSNGTTLSCDKYNSIWSWVELIESLGIKYTNEKETQQKLLDYILKNRH